jgi:hypothetical protein
MELEGTLLCSRDPATGPYLSQMNPVHILTQFLEGPL